MNPELPAEATEFGAAARRAFAALGGIDAARRAEADPTTRADVAEALTALGVDELDPRTDPDAAAAAAVLCEAAGRVVLPHPVEATILRDGEALFAVVDAGHVRVDHADLASRWLVATLDGHTTHAAPATAPLGTRLGPFAGDLAPDRPFEAGPTDAASGPEAPASRTAWWLTLGAWRILGGLAQAVDLAVAHTSEREQFGKPLTAFQTVRFMLADAAVAVAGLRELALFTLWRLHAEPAGALTDALALRCHALDTARMVLRATQQLHGASGLCDELDISILVRHLQPALRLPEDSDATATRLAHAIASSGFAGLFPHGHAA